MPRFDYRCLACGRLEEDVVAPPKNPTCSQLLATWCPNCGIPMEKLPAAPNFAVAGFSAKNGYSKG